MKCIEREVLGYPIRAELRALDDGYDVAVFGGCRSHVGAVSFAEPDGSEQTMIRGSHKEAFITRPWALRLAKAWNAPVCVRAGVHYDEATKEQIEAILRACDGLLEEIISSR